MARAEKQQQRPLHPALPPAQRTVGQLVGEAIRAYGARFWKALALGLPVVVANALVWKGPSGDERLLVLPLTALLVSLSYVVAAGLVLDVPLRRRHTLVAYVVAVLVFLPVPILVLFYILPALAWLALFGLAVPAALVEGLGVRAAVARGLRLARADYVHVLGGIATLALVVIISQFSLYFVLREYAENTRIIAAALAALVVTPLVFLGSAILYVDQEARLRLREEPRKE